MDQLLEQELLLQTLNNCLSPEEPGEVSAPLIKCLQSSGAKEHVGQLSLDSLIELQSF